MDFYRRLDAGEISDLVIVSGEMSEVVVQPPPIEEVGCDSELVGATASENLRDPDEARGT